MKTWVNNKRLAVVLLICSFALAGGVVLASMSHDGLPKPSVSEVKAVTSPVATPDNQPVVVTTPATSPPQTPPSSKPQKHATAQADSDYQLAQICLNSHIQIGNSVLSMYKFYDDRELSQNKQELDLLTNIQKYPEGWHDTYLAYIAQTKAEAITAKQQVYNTALATEQKDSCGVNVQAP